METKTCPMCQSAMKLIPAGVSKRTGKAYTAFYACQNQDCKHTLRWGEDGKSPKEPTWPPKILKAEENVKIDQILEAIKILHHNIIALHKKINDMIAKSGEIPVLDEKEGDEDVIDQDDLRHI